MGRKNEDGTRAVNLKGVRKYTHMHPTNPRTFGGERVGKDCKELPASGHLMAIALERV